TAARAYAAPQGALETAIASIWQDVLGLEQVGRDDHFFELGGHSLSVIGLIEKMRAIGHAADMRSVFTAPTVAGMALHAARATAPGATLAIPGALIAPGCDAITPDMLPMVALSQLSIDSIAARVRGGAANIADIYPLAPLQQGILFHHMMESEGDSYLLRMTLSFDGRARLDHFLSALQKVIDRHDALRTTFFWTGLEKPVQVVLRHAELPVHELRPDDATADTLTFLCERVDPRRTRLDLETGPLLAAFVANDAASGEWHLALLVHHLVSDHVTFDLIVAEVQAFMQGQAVALPTPLPYRNFVAHTMNQDASEQEAYFRALLGDFEEPNAPFGLLEFKAGRDQVNEERVGLTPTLALAIRDSARRHGVTPAVVFHLAWALVLGRCSGRGEAVFGTVLLGRMHAAGDAGQAVGMYINTLPVRIALDAGVVDALDAVARQLKTLLAHEQAPLTVAQRCSAVAPSLPLFASLLNYRHNHVKAGSDAAAAQGWEGIRTHAPSERVTYPIGIMVDDIGQGFSVSAMVAGANPEQVLGMLVHTLEQLCDALAHAPGMALQTIDVLPPQQRAHLLAGLNDTAVAYPSNVLMHQAFEARAAATPHARALVVDGESIGYGELNARANRLAHHLLALGVRPDERVALCVERGAHMIVAMLAILKAGAGYVPLDPAYPAERLAFMLSDSTPVALLTQRALADSAGALAPAGMPLVLLDRDDALIGTRSNANPEPAALGLEAHHLAYVIYTSGSTGLPKGVMIEHRQAANFLAWACEAFCADQLEQTLFSTSINFDLHVFEMFAPLSSGASITLVRDVLSGVRDLHDLTLINTVPSTIQALLDMGHVAPTVRQVNLAGEALRGALVERLFANTPVQAVANLYGPSETTTYSTWVQMERADGFRPHIGRPIANTQIYLLDACMQLVPMGATGEIYIGGAGVARGYLRRDELTAERFLPDPFSTQEGARMYKTGDLGRWLDDGNLAYLGRNDFQVKIRGFRIELGEIEAALAACPGVREAVVLAREDSPGDKRLVAYLVAHDGVQLSGAHLRERLAATLAEFMVPGAFVMLERLPLTPNGKLDRKALPAPDGDAVLARHYEAPQGEVEAALAALWQELLGLEQVSRHDHFFDLGGHSLLAVQLAARIREQCHVEASLKQLFDRPLLHQLAELITQLQLATLSGAEREQMTSDLSALTESELLAILAEESLTNE
ncbi:MAG: amino acid adenylation domain-containing protein, partial [Pseudomonadota bacterium]